MDALTKGQRSALAEIQGAGKIGVPAIAIRGARKSTFAPAITKALHRMGLIATREEKTEDGLRYYWVAVTPPSPAGGK